MNKPSFENTFLIKPEWADQNGHMNMGYYLVAFDLYGTDLFFEDVVGIGWSYLKRENKSTFTLAANIDYIKEVFVNEEMRLITHVLDWDYKRLHYIHSLYNAKEGYLCATNECLTMHVDMATRRSTPFSEATQATIKALYEADKQRPVPEQAFRTLGIRKSPK